MVEGGAMCGFAQVARLAENLAHESSRLKKRAAIAEAVAVAHAEDSANGCAGRFCLYLAGQPFAEADPRKLNAGGALLTRAVRAVSGCTEKALAAAYRRHGDLGSAAHDLLVAPYGEAPAEATLSLDAVAEVFAAMASARETSSRAALVEGLLRRATALEAKYLLKLMLGDMRIGVKQSLIEEAIAVAAGAEVVEVRHAVMLEADLGRAVGLAFAGRLGEARMRLFHPLGFMLASPVGSPEEAVKRFSEKVERLAAEAGPAEGLVAEDAAEEGFAEDVEAEAELERVAPAQEYRGPSPSAQDEGGLGDEVVATSEAASSDESVVRAFLEDKYDGMRAQVHCGDREQVGRVAIYSRNRENITESFPEIVEALHEVSEPLILDGEILGWDVESGRALPFAVLGQRIGRKRVDNAMRLKIPVVFMAFDLLFEGGELLLAKPLSERRARLEDVVARLEAQAVAPLEQVKGFGPGGLFAGFAEPGDELGRLRLSPAKLVESAEAIEQAYSDARARANEGVMLKAAESAYLPGRRGLAWVKLKRELATLDVVITGAEFGHGKRAGLLSDYTFAVRVPSGKNGEAAELLNVGKAYSGVTDAEIAELTRWLKAHTVDDQGHFRTVEPLRVIEVAFNNIMRSERHASGFALRFPRILRIRDDKPVDEIDTLERVEEIYRSQPDRPAD
ncbi:MAG: ATP-dependent DNA ligase [Acidobacteriota bacterium]